MRIEKPKIRKDDTIVVVAGKEIGKSGRVLKVDSEKGRVLVEKLNMIKKHLKPNTNKQAPQGGIISKESYLDYSNVMLKCPKCNKGVRTKFIDESGKKVRSCIKCGNKFDKKQ